MYAVRGIYGSMSFATSVQARYPDYCDRTKDKLLGGLMNATKFNFLQSLPELDPRRRELKSIVYPDLERSIELEKNLIALDAFLVLATGIRTREVYETVVSLGIDEEYIFGKRKWTLRR